MRKSAYLRKFDEWQEALRIQGYSDYTINKSYRSSVLRAYRALIEAGYPTAPNRITKEMAQYVIFDIFNKRADSKAAWNHFLKFCGNHVIGKIKYRSPKSQRINVDWLNLEENEDFVVWESCEGALQTALIHLELHLGLRRIGVKRQEIDWFKRDHIHVLGKGSGGGKPRTIKTHRETQNVLNMINDYREDTLEKLNVPIPDHIMAFKHGKEIRIPAYTTLDNWAKKVSDKSGIHFSHHTLRRTCGRKMFRAGVQPVTIMTHLGHESLAQTVKYLGIDLDDLGEAMNLVDQYDEMRKRRL
ncbi:MAG: site-specific integrase [Candidatus Peribacteraceae bacterium]|nr:site-specific integrase [Candidatus Peribacteraceae bacterium]